MLQKRYLLLIKDILPFTKKSFSLSRTSHFMILFNLQEELVKFELGTKRGKVYVPTYNEAELAAIARSNAVADAVRLDQDEEDALGGATVNDLMTLAEILDTNPQEFIMEAYSDPLKFYPAAPPNTTDVEDAKAKIVANDKNTKVCSILISLDINSKFIKTFMETKYDSNRPSNVSF